METQALKQESPEWVQAGLVTTRSTTQQSDNQNNQEKSDRREDGYSITSNVKLQDDRVTLSEQATKKVTESSSKSDAQLTDSDLEFITRLQARDQEVKTHEAAHLTSAGQYATSGASYTYQEGPNGKNYAIGGEVSIDVSPVPNDPEATISKADTVIKSALSPASPSPQDFKVADQARQMRIQATRELSINQVEDQQKTRQSDAQKEIVQTEEKQKTVADDAKQMSQQEDIKKAEVKKDETKAELQQAEKSIASDQTVSNNSVNNDQTAAKTAEELRKQDSERLASLNELFARYEEARKTYQAIVDFFSKQYEQSKKQDKSTSVEVFA